MDIISHGLWGAAGYRAANVRAGARKFNLRLAAFWGVFPDLFAFSIAFVWIWWERLRGNAVPFPRPETTEPPMPDAFWPFQLAGTLYNYSHSLVVFAVVVALVWFVRRRVPYEMGAWLLHILMDIPTHSYRFFPTPFLWPISSWKFNGFSWGTPWFLALNYTSLALVYLFLWVWKRKKNKGLRDFRG